MAIIRFLSCIHRNAQFKYTSKSLIKPIEAFQRTKYLQTIKTFIFLRFVDKRDKKKALIKELIQPEMLKKETLFLRFAEKSDEGNKSKKPLKMPQLVHPEAVNEEMFFSQKQKQQIQDIKLRQHPVTVQPKPRTES